MEKESVKVSDWIRNASKAAYPFKKNRIMSPELKASLEKEGLLGRNIQAIPVQDYAQDLAEAQQIAYETNKTAAEAASGLMLLARIGARLGG